MKSVSVRQEPDQRPHSHLSLTSTELRTSVSDEIESKPPAFPNDTMRDALARHSIQLPDATIDKLDLYCKLLWEWNEKINLTRHTDYERFVSRDVVDTMHLAKLLRESEEVLDVGSGGGVPGITLAIVRPDLQMTLSDNTGKKVNVLRDMVEKLGLECAALNFRSEDLLDENRFDALTIRAVGPLDRLLTWFKPYWASIRRLLVVKGPKWKEEQAEASRRGLLRELQVKVAAEYPLAGTPNNSVVLKIWPKNAPER
ncbi:methyltransferase GidB [Pirellula staleyi DSM 6068]|uniref:Ribosomal RNA small subunit methyltransferase G n=1 Tax=Pirellula staleyi (strain ATCC 27377 / DSM 6068 / ICPB 4128) TaxID=530564 RepID=D2R4K8_PIRSD|nr:methyltransferase GidB [Pirellula staleyi DSM 6068]